MAGMTALPADGKDGTAEALDGKDGWENVKAVLGEDLGTFLRESRARGRHKVVASSEGGRSTLARVQRINDLLREDGE